MGRDDEPPSNLIPASGQPMEECHIEACLDFLAHLMGSGGDVYAPIYDRLETELEILRRRRSPLDRARMRIAAYTLDGAVKAIR